MVNAYKTNQYIQKAKLHSFAILCFCAKVLIVSIHENIITETMTSQRNCTVLQYLPKSHFLLFPNSLHPRETLGYFIREHWFPLLRIQCNLHHIEWNPFIEEKWTYFSSQYNYLAIHLYLCASIPNLFYC